MRRIAACPVKGCGEYAERPGRSFCPIHGVQMRVTAIASKCDACNSSLPEEPRLTRLLISGKLRCPFCGEKIQGPTK